MLSCKETNKPDLSGNTFLCVSADLINILFSTIGNKQFGRKRFDDVSSFSRGNLACQAL